VMFADAEDVQTNLIGKLNSLRVDGACAPPG
jgi:hypothetical protein